MDITQLLLETGRMPRLRAAAAFAAAGYPVFPCVPRGKRPLVRSGFHDAATDERRVGAWWRRWPEANIGMPTGPRSGVDVVDIDVRAAGSGFTAYGRATEAGLVGGEVARVRTPSGGMHVYFCAIAPQPCWQAAGAHVDFRGDGGYVLVPPSEITTPSGFVRYEALSLPPAGAQPLDARALRAFVDPRPTRARQAPPAHGVEPTALVEWVARLREGERNRGLFWAACRLFENGMPPEPAIDLLSAAAGRAGLEEVEIVATVLSAWRRTRESVAPLGPSRPTAREMGASACQR